MPEWPQFEKVNEIGKMWRYKILFNTEGTQWNCLNDQFSALRPLIIKFVLLEFSVASTHEYFNH